jgi:hypothetical protein
VSKGNHESRPSVKAFPVMKALLFLFSCVSILGAQGVEGLIAEGDALDRKNRNFEAVAFYLKADSETGRGKNLVAHLEAIRPTHDGCQERL